MAFEALRASAMMILDEIAKCPDDRHVLQEQLREKIAEFRGLGLPVPEDLIRFEAELSEADAPEIFPGS
ncbi:hypothetical protein [Candidatus Halocynthiibacter alkanivorans]|jgi:hypothetical protein|uniref:hypothetical protein n=1 Tax=Candidatus Halocynthiibacter alkanivorans TaxID=2267619 RepID=UPI000DF49B0A|nr:hypothetical protein [Candidatus Halocynthiibacter alkanivorans]